MTPSKKTRIANIATYSCGGLFALILVISWFVDKRPPNATLALIESGKAGLFGAVLGQIVSRIALAFVKTDADTTPDPPSRDA